jgi:hypothetical protein
LQRIGGLKPTVKTCFRERRFSASSRLVTSTSHKRTSGLPHLIRALYEWRVIRPRHFNCNREDFGKRWPTWKDLSTRPGHKGALAVRFRKLAIDGEKKLQGVAELAYQQSLQV